MKKKIGKPAVAAAFVAVIAVFCLCATGCKGRTMDNMEPTGDTVEVVINVPGDAPSDTTANAI